ncbi:MAG: hypothetical protein O3B47_05355, partial [bacterium]|nr:hypothetical protein [bacterium]
MPNKDENPEFEKKSSIDKEKGDYAKKVWDKIENKAHSKGKRGDLKEELKEDTQVKKKKRRRPRKKKSSELSSDLKDKNEVKDSQKEQEEPVHEEPLSPTAHVMPINPFADTSLPPKEHENRFKEQEMEAEDEGDQDFEKEPEELKNEVKKSIVEDEDPVVPVNPFEPIKKNAPLDEKALDEKPLDEVTEFDNNTTAEFDDGKTEEDRGHADEVVSPDLEPIPKDYSEKDELSENEDVKAEDEVIDVTPLIPGEVEAIDSEPKIEEFKENFWDVLEQVGITKKRFIGILVFLGVIIFGLLIFVFGLFGDSDEVSELKDETSEVTSETLTESHDVVASFIIGEEHKSLDTVPIGQWGDLSGVRASYIFGEPFDLQQAKFVEYVNSIRKLDNLFKVDIYSLVDLAVNRREALDLHLAEMEALIRQAENDVASIDEYLKELQVEYQMITTQVDAYELEFFGNLEKLYGQNSYDY